MFVFNLVAKIIYKDQRNRTIGNLYIQTTSMISQKTIFSLLGGPIHQWVIYCVWGFMQANVHMDNKWSIFAKKNAKQMIFDKIYSKKHLSNSND